MAKIARKNQNAVMHGSLNYDFCREPILALKDALCGALRQHLGGAVDILV